MKITTYVRDERELVTVKINPLKEKEQGDVLRCIVDTLNASGLGFVKQGKYRELRDKYGSMVYSGK